MELWLLNMCDTEPDREMFGGMPMTQHIGQQAWRGVTDALPKFIEQCDSVRDDFGFSMKMTLFIRSDSQIAEFYGRPGWALHHFKSQWDKLLEKGHDIGWHPHLWRWSEACQRWCPEKSDEQWIREECLTLGYKDFISYMPVRVSRMGWCYHNNCTMQLIDRLGMRADFSGLTGIGNTIIKGHFMFGSDMVDWSLTPNYAYHPSKVDYRIPASDNETALSILEIPQDTLELSPMMRIVYILKNISNRRALKQFRRKIITMHSHRLLLLHRFVKQHIRRVMQEEKPVILSWSMHADDLLVDNIQKIIFRNIEHVQKETKQARIKLRFVTASQIVDHFKR